MPRALELLAQDKPGRGGRRTPKAIKVFENVEEIDGGNIQLLEGRYGPYVSDGEVNASLAKGFDPEELTVTLAVELLEARRAKGGVKKRKKKAAKKATKKKAAKKPAAKKKAAKKPAAKKAAKKTAKKATKKTASKKSASKKTAGKKASKKTTTTKETPENPDGES